MSIRMTMTEVETEQGILQRYEHDIYASAPVSFAANLVTGSNETQEREFTTNGWDTVFAIRATDANAAIARKATSPKTWEVDLPASALTAALHAAGTFGTWQLTTGGSGAIINMAIPFPECTITGGPAPLTVRDGVVNVAVRLAYLPPEKGDPVCKSNPASTAGPHKLVLNHRTNDPQNPAVTVVGVTYAAPERSEGVDDVLIALLKKYLNAHLEQFQHVFATVDLGTNMATDAFQWLKPTDRSYAYVDAPTLEDALFGVLAMTECRSSAAATQAIAPGAIPQGARAGFSISEVLLLQKMMLPNLKHEFAGTDDSFFDVNSNGTQILSTKPFPLTPVNVAGVNYTPVVETFRVTITGDTIETYAYMRTNISPGVDAWSEVTHYATLELVPRKDQTQTIGYRELRPPVQRSGHDVATWVTIVQVVADVIVGVVTLAIGAFIRISANVIVRVIIRLLVGAAVAGTAAVLGKTPEWIAGAVPLPPVNAFASNATSSVRWTGAGEFKLTSVHVNRALQLGGDPMFAS